MKNVIILSLLSIGIISCLKNVNEENKANQSEQKTYTFDIAREIIDFVEAIETFDVKPSDPEVLTHSSNGEVVFISKKFEAPIEFHQLDFSYRLNEMQYREDHEQLLKLYARYSSDNESWSSWTENCLVGGEGAGSPEKYINRSCGSSQDLRKQFGGAFKYYQFKLVSSPQNQGKILLENLKLGILRFSNKKK